jgi:hypothetical protein
MILAGSSAIEDEKKDSKEIKLKSAEYPPYDAVIPYMSTKYLTYELSLVDLRGLYAFPTRLESMTSILAYGFDIFFIRVSPENNFDLLQEGFNYSLLFVVIGGLAIAMFVVKYYYNSGTSRNNFLLL